MIELTRRSKLARSMLHKIVANGFIGAHWQEHLRRIRRFDPPTILYIGRMVVLARHSILASSCAEVIATVFDRKRGHRDCHDTMRDLSFCIGRSIDPQSNTPKSVVKKT